jgi:hypothetical protein
MTHWGYLLLIVFVALGVSPLPARKAGRLMALISLAVIAFAFYQYGAL